MREETFPEIRAFGDCGDRVLSQFEERIYWFQCFLSFTSSAENFQFLLRFLSRSVMRIFCSFFEICRKNLTITVPFCDLTPFGDPVTMFTNG